MKSPYDVPKDFTQLLHSLIDVCTRHESTLSSSKRYFHTHRILEKKHGNKWCEKLRSRQLAQEKPLTFQQKGRARECGISSDECRTNNCTFSDNTQCPHRRMWMLSVPKFWQSRVIKSSPLAYCLMCLLWKLLWKITYWFEVERIWKAALAVTWFITFQRSLPHSSCQ